MDNLWFGNILPAKKHEFYSICFVGSDWSSKFIDDGMNKVFFPFIVPLFSITT